MARFRGILQGNRGETSRLGSTHSGMVAHVDGWKVGVTVRAMVDDKGRDVLTVYRTGGSDRSVPDKIIATIVAGDGEP